MSRKNVSTRTRFEIFKRDKFTCQYCGSQPPAVILHVDHILAVANGGTNDTENLTTACEGCNLGKSSVPLNVSPKSLKETALEAQEMTEQIEAHAEMIRLARESIYQAVWEVAEVIQPGAESGFSRDKFSGIERFVKEIGSGKTMEAAHIAEARYGEGNRRFKYFCGICWNRIREAQEL